jgi:hypothetical protein
MSQNHAGCDARARMIGFMIATWQPGKGVALLPRLD